MSSMMLMADQVEAIAASLASKFDLSFFPGTRHILVVKETRTHAVLIHQTTFNWRLSTARLSDLTGFDQGWCYTGKTAFAMAYGQALLWPDDDDGTHRPDFWYRDLTTDERRREFLFRD